MTDNMRKQWDDLKAKHSDALLLFRCGDFYETYGEDAKECAKILGITLTWGTTTKRHVSGDYSDAMAGFPYYALDKYLPLLIRAGKRVAICDQLEAPKPTVKRGVTEQAATATNTTENANTESTTIMATNMKAADLIGKVLILGDGSSKYAIKGVEGDKLQCDFIRGDGAPVQVPMTPGQIETMLVNGKGYWEGDAPSGAPAPASDVAAGNIETVEEVSAITPQKPTASTPTDKSKAEKSVKPKKQDKPKTKAEPTQTYAGALKYEAYTNKKGKVCARIVGLNEDDEAYQRAAELHASATYERTKKGDKVYLLIFGPRYADAAKNVCDLLNMGKPLADCRAIIDNATEERAKQREEWKSRREERKAQAETAAETKTVKSGYSAEAVAKILKDVMNGGKLPKDIEDAMTKTA